MMPSVRSESHHIFIRDTTSTLPARLYRRQFFFISQQPRFVNTSDSRYRSRRIMANADNSPKRGKIEIIKKHVHSYSDFPKPGVLFRDIFGVLQSPEAFSALKDLLIEEARRVEPAVQCVVGLESRGFLFGPSIALDLQVPFVPIRKKGKLPGQVFSHSYLLEYGEDTIEIQGSAIKKGQSVLIVDDLLATGGSLKASCELIKTIGSTVASCLVVIELESLNGRANISAPVISLIKY